MPAPKRLDKYLADATSLSRSDINAAWDAGRIEVRPDLGDSSAATWEPWPDDYELWSLIFDDDVVLLDGEVVEPSPARHYFALHKPEGILTTTSDPHGRECLEPWLDELPDTVFPVGRLDRPTTGFLLMTDDGDLCFCLLRKRFGVEKEYHLTVEGPVADDDERLARLEAGIDIGDRKPPATALRAEVVESGAEQSLLSVVVDEGRHRMVRRMARRAEFRLQHLHRPRIGPVTMDRQDEPLEAGEYRRLSDAEVDAMWQACGGREAARKRRIAALGRQAQKWRDQDRPHPRLEAWLSDNG
ncbi:pseudouridine synthase [Persicimonas caeni]|nr:pseudouridine synthase [Persicimonas caeni]